MTYQEQIKHPNWQKKRLEVLELRGFTCQDCQSTDTELHVHHPFYTKGAMIWEYKTEDLMCLCSECHEFNHKIDAAIKEAVGVMSRKDKSRVLGYIDAMSVPSPKSTGPNYRKGFLDRLRGDDEMLLPLLDELF